MLGGCVYEGVKSRSGLGKGSGRSGARVVSAGSHGVTVSSSRRCEGQGVQIEIELVGKGGDAVAVLDYGNVTEVAVAESGSDNPRGCVFAGLLVKEDGLVRGLASGIAKGWIVAGE